LDFAIARSDATRHSLVPRVTGHERRTANREIHELREKNICATETTENTEKSPIINPDGAFLDLPIDVPEMPWYYLDSV